MFEVRMRSLRLTALVVISLAAVLSAVSAPLSAGEGPEPAANPVPVEARGQSKVKKAKVPETQKKAQEEYEKGVIALRYGLIDQAIRYGKQGLEFMPDHFNSLALLGSAYYTKGEYGLSAESYEKASALKPNTAEILRNLGLAYIELKETAKAFAALEKAFELSGEAEAAYYLGRLCYTEKRYDEALKYASESIRKDGKSARAYNLKGVVLNQMGRYLEAAGSFQAGLILAPEDIGLQINLGIAYVNTSEPAKAKAVFEAVLPKIEDPALKSQVEGYIRSIKDDRT
jgi:tetratricopeptide (TPR) repeat protein